MNYNYHILQGQVHPQDNHQLGDTLLELKIHPLLDYASMIQADLGFMMPGFGILEKNQLEGPCS